jgi:aromatic amino acid aminotransferase I / 2-aminoadipate transaminase
MSPPSAMPIEDLEVIGVPGSDTQAITNPDPITGQDFLIRRKAAGAFNGGIAAATSSDLFKSPPSGKPLAKRWDHKLSLESRTRCASSLKAAARLLTKDMISLGGGLPSSEYFPFEHIEIKVPSLGKWTEAETKESGEILRIGKHDVAEGKSSFGMLQSSKIGRSSRLIEKI